MMGPQEEEQPIPEDVKAFLEELLRAVVYRNHELMKVLYEQVFNRLTEIHYSEKRWPPESQVAEFYNAYDGANDVLMALYRELYYRHVVAHCGADLSWHDRYLSSINYERLLEYLIEVECRPNNLNNITIPPQWIWDMLDEFVYQYQETQRWKVQYAREIAESEVAMNAMNEGSAAWRCPTVLRHLYSIVKASNIEAYLEQQRELAQGIRSSAVRVDPRELPTYLGFFATVSLLRLYVALGDYRTGVAVVNNIDLHPFGLLTKVPACHLTLVYNLGFAYMMMRRYQDAVRVCSQFLLFVGRNKTYLSSLSFQQDAMNKMLDRVLLIVMLSSSLSPVKLDESIVAAIQEKRADKYAKLQANDMDGYLDVFVKACPKYFNPFVSEYNDPKECERIDSHELLDRQARIFLKDVVYQTSLFNVRSIARLYNNLTLSKLATLMDPRNDKGTEGIRAEILCVKNRACQTIWQSGSLLQGELVQLPTDLEIYMDLDTIHVKNLAPQRNYIDLFLKQIQRTQEAITTLSASSTTASSSAAS